MLVGRRCSRPVDRRCGGASINSDFGERSVAGCRVRRPQRWPAYRPQLESVGFVRGVACQRSAQPRCRVDTCRLASERISPSCMRKTAVFGRSRVDWVVRLRRSRGNCVTTPQPVAGTSGIGPRPLSGILIVAPSVRRWPQAGSERCSEALRSGAPGGNAQGTQRHRRAGPENPVEWSQARTPSGQKVVGRMEPGADFEPASGRFSW